MCAVNGSETVLEERKELLALSYLSKASWVIGIRKLYFMSMENDHCFEDLIEAGRT
jgi:hypothetical protein